MPQRQFNVGDRVRIRQWEDMRQEFGLNWYGSIACQFGFTIEMTPLCGQRATIQYISDDGHIYLVDDNREFITGWNISADMLELVVSHVQEEEQDGDLLHVGDWVQIRKLPDLKRRSSCSHILFIDGVTFVPAMKPLCGLIARVVRKIDGDIYMLGDNPVLERNQSQFQRWHFTEGMLKKVEGI